jgi:uncharacterized protein YjaG (DUF416 family)
MNISELQKETHDLAKQLEAETKKMVLQVQEFQSLVEMVDPETLAKLKPIGGSMTTRVGNLKKANDKSYESYQTGLDLAKKIFLLLAARCEREMQERIEALKSDIQEVTSTAEFLSKSLPKQKVQ